MVEVNSRPWPDPLEVHSGPWPDAMFANIIPRSEWGALPPKEEIEELPLPMKNIGYSCDTEIENVCWTKEECTKIVQQLQKQDMEEKGFPDIAYNFLIGEDGNVYEGRGWDKRPQVYYKDKEKYGSMMDVAFIGISQGKFLHYRMYEKLVGLKNMGIESNKIVENPGQVDFCDKEEDYFEGVDIDDLRETEFMNLDGKN